MLVTKLEALYDEYEYEDKQVGILVKKNFNIGLVDKNLNIVIPLMYESLYLVEFNKERMIAQLNNSWLLINAKNEILYKSTHNYESEPVFDMSCFDASYKYVSYLDGYIEHYKDKIILKTKETSKEFYLQSESALSVDDTPLIYFFDGAIKGYLNLETGFIQLDVLIDVRKKGFQVLNAYEIDDILCTGEKPYSLFHQDFVIEELKNNGVTTIINLMEEHEYHKYNLVSLKKEFTVINFPIVDKSVPNIETIYKIIHSIAHSQKTYIHSNAGLGRTTVLVGYYLYKKYAYTGENIIKKIEELKKDSKLVSTKISITKAQEEFLIGLLL